MLSMSSLKVIETSKTPAEAVEPSAGLVLTTSSWAKAADVEFRVEPKASASAITIREIFMPQVCQPLTLPSTK